VLILKRSSLWHSQYSF